MYFRICRWGVFFCDFELPGLSLSCDLNSLRYRAHCVRFEEGQVSEDARGMKSALEIK